VQDREEARQRRERLALARRVSALHVCIRVRLAVIMTSTLIQLASTCDGASDVAAAECNSGVSKELSLPSTTRFPVQEIYPGGDRALQRSTVFPVSPEAAACSAYLDALKRIQSCKMFCHRVSQTASMHSPPVTLTEMNMHNMLQNALSEIQRQLESLETEVGVGTLSQQLVCGDSSSTSSV